ncbi:hypothetical protein QA802_39685 [Streptomyces sp. B21-105]|uniref:hypothetical protein n=1 Tax=Streptomyces sp. B21-105 TaxID=3039417 RepID=UPI002FF1762E
MTDCYPYRVATAEGEVILIWRPGGGDDPDALAVDGVGRLLAFHDLDALQDHCDRDGRCLVREGEAALDLAAVDRWVRHPGHEPVSAGLLLDAWNFFDDLSRSVDVGPPLPSRGSLQDVAYEKIFGGEARTDEETAAVRELLRVGLQSWEQAVNTSATG